MGPDTNGMGKGANGFSDPLADHGGWRWNLESREIEWSRATYLIHGVVPGDFVPTMDSIRPLIHPDDLERYRESVDTAISTRAPFTVQHRIVRPDGAVRTLVVRGAFLPASNGHPDTLVGTTEDITSRERSGDLLWHLANHDPLTGLLNRRRLMEELEREVAVAERRNQPGAVLMLDLDEFKEVNDLLGHNMGDTILTRVGDALRSRLRSTDALARLGGDEFAVVTAIIASMIGLGWGALNESPIVFANLALVVLYSAIGYYLIRTQLANRRPLGGWSVSGLALAIVFPTCAMMHGVYAYYATTGAYHSDWHLGIVDIIAVPAAIYFLWVVQALYRGTFHDWNGAPQTASQPSAKPAPAAAG